MTVLEFRPGKTPKNGVFYGLKSPENAEGTSRGTNKAKETNPSRSRWFQLCRHRASLGELYSCLASLAPAIRSPRKARPARWDPDSPQALQTCRISILANRELEITDRPKVR